MEAIFVRHRGHGNTDSSAAVACAAAAPHCGQCLLPMNIKAKQEGQATVASFDSQYRHCGESDEMAAPQLGQLRVFACIDFALGLPAQLSTETKPLPRKFFILVSRIATQDPIAHGVTSMH
jgi:hypothetical protein